jgi:hypothetical protein
MICRKIGSAGRPRGLLAIANTFGARSRKCLIGKDSRALAKANTAYFLNAAGSSEWRFRRE